MENSVLVTVGHPLSDVPILPFCQINVKESVAKSAKNLRKQIAEEPNKYGVYFLTGQSVSNITPAELYWACYHNSTDEKPFLASDNFWAREALKKEAEEKAEQERLQRLGERAIKMIEMEIHLGKCPNCGCYALVDGFCQACQAHICPECFSVMDENFQCGGCGYGL